MYISPIEHVISLLSPDECIICKAEGSMLCDPCAQELIPEALSRCYKCNKITSQNRVCSSCRSSSRLRRVWWLSLYEGDLKKLIYKMKYGRRRSFARQFGLLLSAHLPYVPADTVVIAVPTVSSRMRRRGFDQAVLIAQAFAQARRLPCLEVFTRTNQTDQIGKSRQQRMKQIQQSLTLRPNKPLEGTSVLLIDDVLTTGATLETAAMLLRDAGVKHVDSAVVCRHLI